MISQFADIPEDMVFTEGYSVRAARTAVYTLLGLNKKVCPVTQYCNYVRTIGKAIITSYC
jgi:oleate hydratase